MQNARAHDLVERHLQAADPVDRQLMDLEIGQVVLAPEFLCVPNARRAEVDPDDPAAITLPFACSTAIDPRARNGQLNAWILVLLYVLAAP